jgi:hypothetical protein
MTVHDEDAWVVSEYIKGRPQTEIGAELGVVSSSICQRIARFCWSMGYPIQGRCYGEDRIALAAEALYRHLQRSGKLTKPRNASADLTYAEARHEHAWLLRAEGKTFEQIAERLNVTRERARQIVAKFSRRMQKATRKTRFTLHLADGSQPMPATIYEQTVSEWFEPGWYIRGFEYLGPCDSRDEARDRFRDLPARMWR